MLIFKDIPSKEDFEGNITDFLDKAQKDRSFAIMVVSGKNTPSRWLGYQYPMANLMKEKTSIEESINSIGTNRKIKF